MNKPRRTANAAPAATIVIIGAGPRGAGLLERLCANAPELFPGRRLDIHVVDPYPFGAGRIWRWDQSPLLWANSMTADTTMFTDDSCTIDGPIVPGPDMAQWAVDSREAPETPLRDPRLNAELRSLTGASFPTRQLVNEYLAWMFWRTVKTAPDTITVRVHPERALELTDAPDGRQQVTLEHSSAPLVADIVLLALGHLPSRPVGESAEIAEFADRHGLTYLAESYTADADLSQFGPGDDVIVRGFGLAFIDLMVLLAEERGGTFIEDDVRRLTYRPSGREPRLHVGSRRGIPYRSKLTYALQGPRPVLPRFLDVATVDRLLAVPGAIDVQKDVWPLIVREILFGYYHELFLGHPERVRLPWKEFEPMLAEAALPEQSDSAGLPNSDGLPIGLPNPAGPPNLADIVAAAVPDPADRFDLDAFDRPLHGHSFDDAAELQTWIRAHIVADLDRRSDPKFSADLGAFGALLGVLVPLTRLVSSGRISARSQVIDLPRFLSFFSYFASGPPPRRLRELLALSDAGVVRFLGPDAELRCLTGDSESGESGGPAFVASSPAVPREVRARALIEARIPQTTLADSADPLVQAMHARGELAEHEVHAPEAAGHTDIARTHIDPATTPANTTPTTTLADTDPTDTAADTAPTTTPADIGPTHTAADRGPATTASPIRTGRVMVTSDFRIIDAAGHAHPRRYGFGAWTSAATAAAFSRPRTNSPFFQQNDAAARNVLKLLSESNEAQTQAS